MYDKSDILYDGKGMTSLHDDQYRNIIHTKPCACICAGYPVLILPFFLPSPEATGSGSTLPWQAAEK